MERVRSYKKRFYVYELQYPDGTPFYVGKGSGDRAWQHLKRQDNIFVVNIIKKIFDSGKEPVVSLVFTYLTEEEAFTKEKELIAEYGRRDIGTGTLCNLTDGGEGITGARHTPESKAKISKALRGRKFTDDWKAKISRAKKGTVVTKEHRRKLSQANIGKNYGKIGINSHRFGKVNSEETKQKISLGLKKSWQQRKEAQCHI